MKIVLHLFVDLCTRRYLCIMKHIHLHTCNFWDTLQFGHRQGDDYTLGSAHPQQPLANQQTGDSQALLTFKKEKKDRKYSRKTFFSHLPLNDDSLLSSIYCICTFERINLSENIKKKSTTLFIYNYCFC